MSVTRSLASPFPRPDPSRNNNDKSFENHPKEEEEEDEEEERGGGEGGGGGGGGGGEGGGEEEEEEGEEEEEEGEEEFAQNRLEGFGGCSSSIEEEYLLVVGMGQPALPKPGFFGWLVGWLVQYRSLCLIPSGISAKRGSKLVVREDPCLALAAA
ncbi:hypothetical protein HZH68_015158 [Vespula germanica]|uniref:Uncharacterized protein n=1 Tax=Vespula germanica TaxID=30212 RepID=A0A834JAA4_VESGE|nr:hypothetical protein HZH68_015158 [Vespula germanica]